MAYESFYQKVLTLAKLIQDGETESSIISNAEIASLHQNLADELSGEKLPVLEQSVTVSGADLMNGIDIRTLGLRYLRGVFNEYGTLMQSFKVVPSINSLGRGGRGYLRYGVYTFVGTTVTGHFIDQDTDYRILGFSRYELSDNEEDDRILDQHPELLTHGLIYYIKKWELGPVEDLVPWKAAYDTFLETARDDLYKFHQRKPR